MEQRREENGDSRLQSPYTRMAVEWIMVTLLAGIVIAILGVAAAVVYWAWGV